MNFLLRNKGLFILLSLLCGAVLLMACGGSSDSTPAQGGSKTTLSGTVASGAPVSGMVYVTGALGKKVSAAIGADGSYSLNVAGLTAPYMVYAEGTAGMSSVSMYSAATSIGNLNITPVTDFIVRSALNGADPDVVFNDMPGNSGLISSTVLDAAEDLVRTQLLPVLSAAFLGTSVDPSSVDLMSLSFSADHTGMDLVLDVLDISISGTSVTVTNNLTNESFTQDVTQAGEPGLQVAVTLTDALEIQAVWAALSTLLAGPSPATTIDSWITAYVADDFIDGGENKTYLLATWNADPAGEGPPPGTVFTTFPIGNVPSADVPAGYDMAYKVWLKYEWMGQSETWPIVMVNSVGSVWQWYGDQRWVQIAEAPLALMERQIGYGYISNSSGLQFYISDALQYAFNNGVQSAVINGPGLSPIFNGIALQYDGQSNTSLSYYGSPYLYWLTDAEAAAISDNDVYNVLLCPNLVDSFSLVAYDDCVTPLQQYENPLLKAPVMPSDLGDGHFFSFTNLTVDDIGAYVLNGASFTVRWTNPSLNGTLPARVSLGLDTAVGQVWQTIEVLPTATSATFDTSMANNYDPMYADFMIEGYDAFGRKVTLRRFLDSGIPMKPGK